MKYPLFRVKAVSRIAFGSVTGECEEFAVLIELEDPSTLVLSYVGIALLVKSDPKWTGQPA
jgi:hypothetical protein